MADQLALFSGPPPEQRRGTSDGGELAGATVSKTEMVRACACILRGGQYDTPKGGSARLGAGWWHDRRCPVYEAPPAELMLLELGRDNLAWVLRHWTGKWPPKAEDFTG